MILVLSRGRASAVRALRYLATGDGLAGVDEESTQTCAQRVQADLPAGLAVLHVSAFLIALGACLLEAGQHEGPLHEHQILVGDEGRGHGHFPFVRFWQPVRSISY